MRHALILRTLSLPLIAALAVCLAMVAMTALSQPASQPHPSAPSVNSLDERTISVDSPAACLAVCTSVKSTPTESNVVDSSGADRSSIAPAEVGETSLPLADQVVSTVNDDVSPPTPYHSRILKPEELFALVGETNLETTIRQRHSTAEVTHSVSVSRSDPSRRQAEDTDTTDLAAAVDGGEGSTEDSAVVPTNDISLSDEDAHAVHVSNSVNSELSVSFLLDKQVLELAPGEDVSTESESASVRFDPGGGRDTETRLLTAGRYEFRLTTEGWELQPESP